MQRAWRARHRDGYAIGQTAKSLSALSVAVGEVGGRQGLAFTAKEYKIFNQTIDDAVRRGHRAVSPRTIAISARTPRTRRSAIWRTSFATAASSARMAFQVLESGQVAMRGRTADIIRRSLRRMESLAEKILFLAQEHGFAEPPSLESMKLAPVLRDVADAAVVERGILV